MHGKRPRVPFGTPLCPRVELGLARSLDVGQLVEKVPQVLADRGDAFLLEENQLAFLFASRSAEWNRIGVRVGAGGVGRWLLGNSRALLASNAMISCIAVAWAGTARLSLS